MANRPKLKDLAYVLASYSNSTIPQTYINELSDYELLLTILNKINEIIERCNQYDDAINEVIEYLGTLDEKVIECLETLDEKVIEYLDDLKESGWIAEQLKEQTTKDILIIGDSYAVGESANVNYPDLLALKGFNITKIAEGGAGFSAVNILGHTFNDMINNYSGRTNFTDVLILGGTNDCYTSDVVTVLKQSIVSTVNNAKTKFADAKIHIGFLSQINRAGGNLPAGVPYQYIACQYTYKNACYQANCCYVSNIEYVLKRKSFINTADGIHPTDAGQYAIANALTSYLKNGTISTTQVVQFPSIDMNNTPFYQPSAPMITFEQIDNNVVVSMPIDWTGALENIPFTFNGVYSSSIYLGTPADSTVFGLSTGNSVGNASQFLTSAPISIVISSTDGKSTQCSGSLFFANGGLFIKVMLLNSKSEFKTLTVDQINIPAFSVTLDALHC